MLGLGSRCPAAQVGADSGGIERDLLARVVLPFQFDHNAASRNGHIARAVRCGKLIMLPATDWECGCPESAEPFSTTRFKHDDIRSVHATRRFIRKARPNLLTWRSSLPTIGCVDG